MYDKVNPGLLSCKSVGVPPPPVMLYTNNKEYMPLNALLAPLW